MSKEIFANSLYNDFMRLIAALLEPIYVERCLTLTAGKKRSSDGEQKWRVEQSTNDENKQTTLLGDIGALKTRFACNGTLCTAYAGSDGVMTEPLAFYEHAMLWRSKVDKPSSAAAFQTCVEHELYRFRILRQNAALVVDSPSVFREFEQYLEKIGLRFESAAEAKRRVVARISISMRNRMAITTAAVQPLVALKLDMVRNDARALRWMAAFCDLGTSDMERTDALMALAEHVNEQLYEAAQQHFDELKPSVSVTLESKD